MDPANQRPAHLARGIGADRGGALARVMVQAGMVDAIAAAAADAVGGAWPLLAPSVGALGTFVTAAALAVLLFAALWLVGHVALDRRRR